MAYNQLIDEIAECQKKVIKLLTKRTRSSDAKSFHEKLIYTVELIRDKLQKAIKELPEHLEGDPQNNLTQMLVHFEKALKHLSRAIFLSPLIKNHFSKISIFNEMRLAKNHIQSARSNMVLLSEQPSSNLLEEKIKKSMKELSAFSILDEDKSSLLPLKNYIDQAKTRMEQTYNNKCNQLDTAIISAGKNGLYEIIPEVDDSLLGIKVSLNLLTLGQKAIKHAERAEKLFSKEKMTRWDTVKFALHIHRIKKQLKKINTLIEDIKKLPPSASEFANYETLKELRSLIQPLEKEIFYRKNIRKIKEQRKQLVGVNETPTESQSGIIKSEEGKSLHISQLKKLSDKTDGKNVNAVNGCYASTTDEEKQYFVKKPDDPREFFTELFAGLVITGLIEKGLIPKAYHDSVIPAQEVILADGSYGLIQPFRKFTPLHSLLGNSMGNKKFALAEILKKHFNDQGYEDLVQDDVLMHGLSFSLMIKLFLADYSVHDGNIGIIENDIETKEGAIKKLRSFLSFDYGAALRAIGKTEISDNIYTSLEEKGMLGSYYKLHKDYTSLYANLPTLYEKIAQHSRELHQNIINHESVFNDIVKNATEKAFTAFKENFGQDLSTWVENEVDLLSYMYGDSEKLHELLTLNDTLLPQNLAENMSELFKLRLIKLSRDAAPQPLKRENIKRYNSFSDLSKLSTEAPDDKDKVTPPSQNIKPHQSHFKFFDSKIARDLQPEVDGPKPKKP